MLREIPTQHLGLWYVFVSLQGVTALLNLGISPAVTRATGYLWAGAPEIMAFGVATARDAAARTPNQRLLSELVTTMRLYYRIFGVVSGSIMLIAGGAWIWTATSGLADATELRLCYCTFVVGAMMNAMGDVWPAFLSGVNAVRSSQKIILASVLVNLTTTFVCILLGLGIWALVWGTVCSGVFLRTAGRTVFLRILRPYYSRVAPTWHLLRRLWPTAWRASLVSLGGYLVISANTLICSATLGLSTTASYGVSLNVIATLSYAASILTLIKVPLANQLRVTGDIQQLREVWIQRTRLTIVVYTCLAIIVYQFGDPALRLIGSRTELLPRAQLGVVLIVFGLEMHHGLYAALVLSENRNPFVVPAIVSGFATLGLSLWLTPRYGVWGMLIAQGCVQASFNNWWPVVRAIRGLEISASSYWRSYFTRPVRM